MRSIVSRSCWSDSKRTSERSIRPAALDVDVVVSVHHQLLDLSVGKQLLERAEADRVAQDQVDDPLAPGAREHAGSVVDEIAHGGLEPDPLRRLGAAALHEPQPQLGGEHAGMVVGRGDVRFESARRPDLSPGDNQVMSAVEVLLVAAVLVGMSVQGAIGFGFAFFVAPAAFAAFPAAQAVMLVVLLGIAINCLVLFGEGRRAEVAARATAVILGAAIPGMFVGAWVVTEVDHETLQVLVGLIVLAGALVQAFGRGAGDRPRRPGSTDAPLLEIAGGFATGVLTTSVTVNGPVLVLMYSRLGLRGALPARLAGGCAARAQPVRRP